MLGLVVTSVARGLETYHPQPFYTTAVGANILSTADDGVRFNKSVSCLTLRGE